MKCGYSREILALYIENDLPSPEAAAKVDHHVSRCAECQQYCEQLQKSQSFVKSRFQPSRQEGLSQERLTSMRRTVLSQIEHTQQMLGWAVQLERFVMMGFRRHRYALAGFAIVAIVSASMLGQIQYSRQAPEAAAVVFSGKDTLVRPADYRQWVFVGSSLGLAYARNQSSEMYHNVYIHP